MFAVPGAYDRAITVFSPDGRLFQVEYASETVKRGATVLGIASPEGVVLAAEERAGSKLKIYRSCGRYSKLTSTSELPSLVLVATLTFWSIKPESMLRATS